MKQKKILTIIIGGLLLFALFLGVMPNEKQAASISSNIDAIDEGKYPGVKQRIKALQATYPNIQVLYTGLDWNTVIKNEHSAAHGRNLVSTSQASEWICQECKNAGKQYDTGLYCASEDAIKYMMDPRNFLNTTDIFQFQKLNTAVGTNTDEIRKVLKMKKVIYLQDDEASIRAFSNVAKSKNLNAYHLITRVIQEQGYSGTTPLTSGNEYVGTNGVTYKGLYNLFSIDASGNGRPQVITNALEKARKEGWITRALSIEGGGNFVGDKYIDVGQNTLYLQKFAVYNTKGQLYWHQYMQNLFGAQNEANILYSTYQITGIQNNRNFTFIIPVYENMPTEPCRRPTSEYKGQINTQVVKIETINSGSSTFISGRINIAEWVDGECRTPNGTPALTLKSTDGTFSTNMYVCYQNGIEYYFDKNIDGLDINKEYYIEARLTGDKNIAEESKKIQRVGISNATLKENYKGRTIKIINSKLVFSEGDYVGNIITGVNELKTVTNDMGDGYIAGKVSIQEQVGTTKRTPRSVPELWLKSTDGKVVTIMFISYLSGSEYYFDKNIENFDTTKEYYIEAKLTTEENISTKKAEKIKLGNRNIGSFGWKKIVAKNDLMLITYVGGINTNLKEIKLIQGGTGANYISGRIDIAEWINDECRVPMGIPKLTLKSTDGKYTRSAYVCYQNGIEYYFDVNIEGLEENKEYYLEAELSNKNNTSTQKIQTVRITDRTIGINGGLKVIAQNNRIKVEDTSKYYGEINTELPKIEIIQNGAGDNYISGRINIAEWVNGSCNTPNGVPNLILKSTDGTVNTGMYVSYQSGIEYYFDKNIQNLDVNKEYYIEAKLTGVKNTAPDNKKTQTAKFSTKTINGKFTDGRKLQILSNNNLKFADDKYYGEINTDLFKMEVIQNGAGVNYISGRINIAEWVDGSCNTPTKLPKMTLKSTDGNVNAGMYVCYQSGIEYYFDKAIDGLDTNKEYYIEVELNSTNNTAPSSKKIQTAKIRQNGEIGIENNGNKVIVSQNKIKIEVQKMRARMQIQAKPEIEEVPAKEEPQEKVIEKEEKQDNTEQESQEQEEIQTTEPNTEMEKVDL